MFGQDTKLKLSVYLSSQCHGFVELPIGCDEKDGE